MTRQHIAIAGSSGLIGSALVEAFRADGHTVTRLVRHSPTGDDQLQWAPEGSGIAPADLQGVDVVVNLCGAGIGDRRWTGRYKQLLRDSRITPTQVLAEAASHAGVPRLVNSSAVGFYGDRRDPVTEDAPYGSGFLAELVRDWEVATDVNGLAVTRMRTAVVLAKSGGMLGRLGPLFRLGLGGKLGTGRQAMSWVSLPDAVNAFRHVIDESIVGPVNVSGPQVATNADFTREVGAVLHRPTIFTAPSAALRIGVGEFADEGLLAGQSALPKVLQDSGFRFEHPTLTEALTWAL